MPAAKTACKLADAIESGRGYCGYQSSPEDCPRLRWQAQ
jgi:hypothetical protein